MQTHPRYEILEEIAAGDFATVYRARDRELNREVAIKQIHPQFLSDQRQLERYWQEAQLLASLEHPNIMTIYDIDRDRGWLILELMNGSLRDVAAGQPMDLDFLRVALVCSLQGLKYLHANGIIHGDVKPSNLMVDKRGMVKLGDFGLAQRAANEQGSLLKGTTKYIAPERVADQFGPVGPASDLYSLGFSMYELMCGEQFDSLFPGLGAFGRDRQIAWLMWHAAADRQAPEISRVLQGVPDDLSHVVQRLIAKDPAQRYATADNVIADLKSELGLGPKPPSEEELAAAEASLQQRRRRKLLLVAAAVSVVLSAAILFWPTPEPIKPTRTLDAAEGVIKHLHLDKTPPRLVLDSRKTVLVRESDTIYLNDAPAEIRALAEGDQLTVTIVKDDAGVPFQELRASRAQLDRGTVASVQPSKNTFELQYRARDGTAKKRLLYVPESLAISFNDQPGYLGRTFKPADLRPGDRVVLRHDTEDDRRVVRELSVSRVIVTRGELRGVDTDEDLLTFTTSANGSSSTLSLPLSSRCEVEINGRSFVQDQPLQPTDLRTGDDIEVHHDTHVVKVVAQRVRSGYGTVQDIVTSRRLLNIKMDGRDTTTAFTLADSCPVTLGDQQVSIGDIQPGDRVNVTYDAADERLPVATRVDAKRDVDRRYWAIVIGVSGYNDKALTAVKHLSNDARHVYQALIHRYRVAEDQVLLLDDPIRAAMEQNLVDFLKRVPQRAQLIVYFGGHAYLDSKSEPYLAARDFRFLQIEQSGLPLTWLIQQVESCAAKNKYLLLDTCHAGSGIDSRRQPSSQKQFELADQDDQKSALRTARLIASCEEGQRGQVDAEGGQFALSVAAGLSGGADQNNDHTVDADELYQFLSADLRTRTSGKQSPAVFGPREIKPPRLSAEAVSLLRELGVALGEQRVDLERVAELADLATTAAPGEPEPALLAGLGKLKGRQYPQAIAEFQSVWRKNPQMLLPLEGMVWCLYKQRQYRSAVSGLVRIVSKLPLELQTDGQLPPLTRRVLPWVGRLREFAATAAPEKYRPAATDLEKIDQAVAASGAPAERLYRMGRDHVRKVLGAFDEQIAETTDKGVRIKIQMSERPRLENYVSFSTEAAIQEVLNRLND